MDRKGGKDWSRDIKTGQPVDKPKLARKPTDQRGPDTKDSGGRPSDLPPRSRPK